MIPEYYRKSVTRRKLYATQKFLAEKDISCPILKGEYNREVVKSAVDRRRALLEYKAADVFQDYFRIERSEIVTAFLEGRDLDTALTSLHADLANALVAVQRGAADEWGSWARSGYGLVTKAARDPVAAWLKRNLGTQIKGITETTRKKIAKQIVAGQNEGLTLREQAQQIDDLYLDEIIPNRSMTIARTEVGRAVNFVQQEIAEEVDVPMEKEWLALDDDRTRASHADADGQRVGLNDPFEVGMSELQYPGDPAGDAEEVINCRCTVLHHVVDEQPRHKSARVESPFQFAKSVTAIESPDVITMLAYAKGVFTEADEWTTARDIVMKHVYRLRRAEKAFDESKHPRDPGGEDGGQFVAGPATGEGRVFTMREPGAEVGHEKIDHTMTRPNKLYRGMTSEEYNATVGAGRGVQSNEAFSTTKEGTSFADKASDAESYVNFGRDDPRKTKLPTYLVEIERGDHATKSSDGYWKAPNEVPKDKISRIYEMKATDGAITATLIGGTKYAQGGDVSDRAETTSHMPEPQRAAVMRIEDELLKRNTGPRGGAGKERMAVIRPDGSILIDKEGGKNHVTFMGSETRMLSVAGDGVGTHNHPANVTLSAEDVMFAWSAGLTEIRAVGRDYTYAIKPMAGKKWPAALITKQMNNRFLEPIIARAKSDARKLFDPMKDALDRRDLSAVKAYNDKIKEWNSTKNAEVQHQAWLLAAPLLSLEYTRSPNPKIAPKKGRKK